MAAAPLRMGLREANQRFNDAIRAIRFGRSVLFTDRGRPIAILRALQDTRQEDEGRTRLHTPGLLRKATRKGPLPPFRPAQVRGASIGKTLRAERDRG